MDLISITDNGIGMEFDDLPYAFCRHATSKIENFEDIYQLHSYGFRGEALASISSISRLTCTSIPKNQAATAGKIEIHGGEPKGHFELPNTGKQGTAIYIKDLFYNTPARLKFVKSKTSEKNSLKKIINAFLISNPQVAFSIKWDEKEREIYNAVSAEDLHKRIGKIIYKKNIPDDPFISFDGEYEGYRVKAHVSKQSSKGNAGKHHYLFVNGRLFADNTLHRAIIRTLEGFWHYGETGHYVFELEVPPNELDVNVHPSKTQIKFFKSGLVYSLITSALKEGIKKEKSRIQGASTAAIPQEALFTSSIDELQLIQEKNFSYSANDPTGEFASHEDTFTPQEEDSSIKVSLKLDRKFTLIKIKGIEHCAVINRAAIIAHEIAELIKANFPIKEEQVIPLLISEPYEVKPEIEEHLELLNQMGLEIDRLTPSTIVLRSIPEYLNDYIITDVVKQLIQIALTSKGRPLTIEFLLAKLIENEELGNTLIADAKLREIVLAKGITALLEQGFLTFLTGDSLAKLFRVNK